MKNRQEVQSAKRYQYHRKVIVLSPGHHERFKRYCQLQGRGIQAQLEKIIDELPMDGGR